MIVDERLSVFISSDSEVEVSGSISHTQPGTQQFTSVAKVTAQHLTPTSAIAIPKPHQPVSRAPYIVPPSEEASLRMGNKFYFGDLFPRPGEPIINPWSADYIIRKIYF
jgi:hypothetical protein